MAIINSKLTFLGTAGDSITCGKQTRASGGIVLNYEDMQILLNPGPGCLVRAKQFEISLRETDAILVTKNSVLDANDLNASIDAMTNGGLDKKGVIVCSPSVTEGSLKFYPAISTYHKLCVEKVVPIKPGDKVALNDIEVVPTSIESSDETEIGFKILTEKFSLSYVGDTAFTKQLTKEHENVDIVILNIPLPSAKKQKFAMSVDDAIKFIEAVQPRLAIITRFGIKMLERDLLNEVRSIQKITGVQTIVAKDGLTLNPSSYGRVQKQRKLV